METNVNDGTPGAALSASGSGAAPTSFYHCFFLHKSGRIDKASIVEADSDQHALLRTLELVDPQSHCTAVEVWQGPRKVFPVARVHADIEHLKRVLLAVGPTIADDPLASQSRSVPH